MVDLFPTIEAAQKDIERCKKRGALYETARQLVENSVEVLMQKFGIDRETAQYWVAAQRAGEGRTNCMPDLNCELTLNKEEAANLWDLCTVLQMGCSFRDTSDIQLLKELQQWLAVTKDQPEPVTLKVTHTDAKNLWDLLAAVRAACKFSKFEGWQFVEDIHQRLQKSSPFAVARVTQTPAGSL